MWVGEWVCLICPVPHPPPPPPPPRPRLVRQLPKPSTSSPFVLQEHTGMLTDVAVSCCISKYQLVLLHVCYVLHGTVVLLDSFEGSGVGVSKP